MRPATLILIGFLLSILGTVLPFLMLIRVLPSTFFLNFSAFIAMVVGLGLGIGGASQYVRQHRK